MKTLLTYLSVPRHLALFLLLASAGILGLAYISQYIFNYDPCVLCLYQRKPYFAVIVLSVAAALVASQRPPVARLLLWACAACFAIGAGVAFFHAGVEQTWWPGTSSCGDTALPAAGDIEALRAYLTSRNVVRCDVPTWKLFGLSMTTYNLIASAILCALTGGLLRRKA